MTLRGFILDFMGELAYSKLEAQIKEQFVPVIQELDSGGVLDEWLKIAAAGGSIWRSAMPRGLKARIKEDIAGRKEMAAPLMQNPERLVEIALGTLPLPLRQKIVKKAPPEYWVGQLQQIWKDVSG